MARHAPQALTALAPTVLLLAARKQRIDGARFDYPDHRGARGARLLRPLLRYGIPGAIAFSRVFRGQHHISDTVAGALLGRWSTAVVRRELISS
ncbi:phosphatase PAP2 family protein [Microbacterium sp. NPDC056569]|uniref:phosphatase PAP2 family protein n=1 Tax=Microbacterium sp. NPDC056569 TaxID=3345867 RepID=UPI00366CB3A2